MGHCRQFELCGISIGQCDSILLLDEGPNSNSERSVYSPSITNANIHVYVFQYYMTVVHVLFLVTVQCTLIESITYMYKREVKFMTHPYHDNVGNTMEKF